MHAENFLHRDIAPDNIIVRADGTPVLLDFGAARRAVAEMSRTMTGIVKAGYSPHEQYSTDSRLQGPWSDLYALGGALYRAVTGKPPEEATLRVDQDRVEPATKAAKGKYRPGFLSAIDSCLKVRHSERPRSVAQLRPMLLGDTPQSRPIAARSKPRSAPSGPPPTRKLDTPSRPLAGRWLAIAAAVVAVLGGTYGGFEYMRWQPSGPGATDAEIRRVADAEARRKAVAEAAQRQAEVDALRQRQDDAQRLASLEAERQSREAAEAAQRQANLDAERRSREASAAAQRQADADAEQLRKEETDRIAAEENARREAAAEEERLRTDERLRVAAVTLSADERTAFVKRVQTVLRLSRCYDGAINGRIGDAQEEANLYVATTSKKGRSRPFKIDLAKATASDFEAWLRDADEIPGDVCTPAPKVKAPAPKPEVAKPARQEPARQARQQREEAPRARPERRAAEPRESSSGGGGGKVCFGGGRNEITTCR
jgi:hypothetical protein